MPALMKDVVVLVPGFLGSVLERDGKELWGLSHGALLRAVLSLGSSVKSLELKDDGQDEYASDGVVASRLLPDTHLLPGLWKVDGYTHVKQTLVSRFNLIEGHNYFEFPYDWRRDVRLSARRLARQAEGWLEHWRRAQGGGPDARLILVAHSLGGVLSRYFLEVLGGWRMTRALLTVGTPYRGSLIALNAIANGFKKSLGPLPLVDLTQMVRSLGPIYQLLPIYPCVGMSDGQVLRPAEAAGIPNMDPERARQGLEFMREIERAVESNLRDEEYVRSGYTLHPVVGISQPTQQGARLTAAGLELFDNEPDGRDAGGDGTVPRVSAMPLEERHHARAMYSATRHASLQNALEVLFHVEGVLTGQQLELSRYRQTRSLSLQVEDAYSHDEPVTVRVRPSQEPVALVAWLERLETRETFSLALERGADGWHQATHRPLPPGVYRVTVKGGPEVAPVRDIFAVFPQSMEEVPSVPPPLPMHRPGQGLRSSAPAAAPAVTKLDLGTARQPEVEMGDESQAVTRTPSIEPLGPARRGQALALRVDLMLVGHEDEHTESTGLTVSGLPADWQQLPIRVQLSCPGLVFDSDEDRGVVLVQRNQASVAATLTGTVSLEALDQLVVQATFECGGRLCGFAQRRIPVEGAAPGAPGSPGQSGEGKVGQSASGQRASGQSASGQSAGAQGEVTMDVDLGDEAQLVVRSPSVRARGPARPGQLLSLRVDLVLSPGAEDEQLEATEVKVRELEPHWKELPIQVQLACSGMTFEPGEDRGVVLVRRNQASLAATLSGMVDPKATEELTVMATFKYGGKLRGSASVTLPVEPGAVLAARSPESAAEHSPVRSSGGATRGRTEGALAVEADAVAPHLTVYILRPEHPGSNQLQWLLTVPVECKGLPSRLAATVDLGADPAAFFRGVALAARELRPGEHFAWFQGLGRLLYERTPPVFRETFRALRQQYGAGFPIQLVTNEPYIPWELMLPADVEGADLLCLEHPVARWLLDYQTWMTSRLPHGGDILTVAPDYTYHPNLEPLPQAQSESRLLQERHGALQVPGRRREVLNVLTRGHARPVSLLHFAGHGSYSGDPATPSRIYLEDGALLTLEVRSHEVRLGQQSRPLVLFNACEVGASSEVLGSMGGWAEAFVSQRFGGFIAPMWPVQDVHARTMAERLVEDLMKGLPVGAALLELRASEARRSPTYLSYVYVGDVMAKLTPEAKASRQVA